MSDESWSKELERVLEDADAETQDHTEEEEQSKQRKKRRQLFRALSPNVRRLLNGVGETCFGRRYLILRAYHLSVAANYKACRYAWDLREKFSGPAMELEGLTDIRVELRSECFCVIVVGRHTDSEDLSEQSLRAALKEAVSFLVRARAKA